MNTDTIIILVYSDKKIRTNPTDPYSILNPDTNSDSPSEKSNGVRLVSAINLINNNIIIIGFINPIKIISSKFIFFIFNLIIITINTINKIANEISYEIV